MRYSGLQRSITLFSSFHCAHFTFSQSHLPDLYGVCLFFEAMPSWSRCLHLDEELLGVLEGFRVADIPMIVSAQKRLELCFRRSPAATADPRHSAPGDRSTMKSPPPRRVIFLGSFRVWLAASNVSFPVFCKRAPLGGRPTSSPRTNRSLQLDITLSFRGRGSVGHKGPHSQRSPTWG